MADVKMEKNVACVVYPGVSMLELTCTYSALKGLEMAKYRLLTVGESTAPVPSDTPLQVVPAASFADVPAPAILAVMGCGLAGLQQMANARLRDYLQSAAQGAELVIGCGGGSVLLAASGLLQGRKATTHWAYQGLLAGFGAAPVKERWVEDGKYLTTAGGTAGFDMGLDLIAGKAGQGSARLLQLFAEYDPQPPYGGIDWAGVKGDQGWMFPPGEVEALQGALADQPELMQVVSEWSQGDS